MKTKNDEAYLNRRTIQMPPWRAYNPSWCKERYRYLTEMGFESSSYHGR
jgi:hypothetical protein